jgi:hypothetical protein
MVRRHLRASELIPFLSALNCFADPTAKDWTAIRILTQIRRGCTRMHADVLVQLNRSEFDLMLCCRVICFRTDFKELGGGYHPLMIPY